MVKGTATWLVILSAIFAVRGGATELPAYRLGDVATNDVIATTSLLVVDEDTTTEIRSREAGKIDPFVVFSTNHAAFIEKEIRRSVTRMREDFLALLQADYGTRRLLPEVIESNGFQERVAAFLSTSPGPPVPPEILFGWAAGRSEEVFLEDWFTPLREVMLEPIRPDRLPDGVAQSERTRLCLVPVNDLGRLVKERFALSNNIPATVADLVPLANVQHDLQESFPEEETAVGSFMVKQLRPNCRFDADLTRRVRDFAVSGLVQMKRFEPGEVVIRKGQVIDEPALAALAEMHERAKLSDLEQQLAVGKVAVQLLSERNLWLAGLLGGTGFLLVVVLVWANRRKRRDLLPVLSSSFVHQGAGEEGWAEATVVDAQPAGSGGWQHRALEAERRADRAATLARSNLIPHLAQQLKDNLVQQLAAQVDDMMDVQAAVADQLSSMEERLERMHAPLQERLRVYEQRISELEGELAQRGQENQLLLRARIEALRWQMEQERSGAGVN